MLYILQTSMHAWHLEYIAGLWPKIQSLIAHTNPPVSEVWHQGFGVYVSARHRHRGVEWIDEMCDKNSIFACFDVMFTYKSHDLPGYRSWFHFSIAHGIARELRSFVNMAARPTAARAKHQSNHRRTKPVAGNEELMWSLMIYYCANLRVMVWYKREKVFGMWSEWYYTTRGWVYEYIITRATRSWLCIRPPISHFV